MLRTLRSLLRLLVIARTLARHDVPGAPEDFIAQDAPILDVERGGDGAREERSPQPAE